MSSFSMAGGLFLFFIGLFFGSFLNVIIDRLPRGKSFATGRSHCKICHHVLTGRDLVPLLSYLRISGKCRYCRSPLSLKYPLLEILTGILFASTFYSLVLGKSTSEIMTWQFVLGLIYSLYILSSFLIIFFIDLEHGFIPDKIIYPAIGISLLFLLIARLDIGYIISGVGAFVFFYAIYFFSKKRGMGLGDVKFSILLGLFLGFPKIVIALYIAFLTGAVISLILIIAKKKKFHGGSIPFGPFMALGAAIAFFYR